MAEETPAGRDASGGESREGDTGPRLLRVEGLTKRYRGGDRPALDAVSVTVPRGEILGVVGRSGSGKTTLLRLVAGLETPTAGRVWIAGREVAGPGVRVPPEDRPLGMLFQEGALFPHLRVVPNVEFGLRDRSREARRARAREVLRMVGLTDHDRRYPHQLSGGERRRVALARALAPGPELLLLDEPFTGLDEDLTARLRVAVTRILRQTGTTALLVLHHTDEVLPSADRIAVMRQGRIVQAGTPREVYARPRTGYVARLFGPANVLPARLEAGRLETSLGPVEVEDGWTGGDGDATGPGVCFRPEDLELVPTGDGAAAGRVVETGYRGDRLDVSVRLEEGGDPDLVVRLPGGRKRAPAPGDRVGVRAVSGRGHPMTGPVGTDRHEAS